MALLIEDGSVVAGADSYADTADLSSYLTDRGYEAIANQEPMLRRAYDFMKGLNWCDDHTQPFVVDTDLVNGQCEIAYRFSLGFDPSETISGDKVKREKVDVLETEFFATSATTSPILVLKKMPQAHVMLKDLLCYSGSNFIDRA